MKQLTISLTCSMNAVHIMECILLLKCLSIPNIITLSMPLSIVPSKRSQRHLYLFEFNSQGAKFRRASLKDFDSTRVDIHKGKFGLPLKTYIFARLILPSPLSLSRAQHHRGLRDNRRGSFQYARLHHRLSIRPIPKSACSTPCQTTSTIFHCRGQSECLRDR